MNLAFQPVLEFIRHDDAVPAPEFMSDGAVAFDLRAMSPHLMLPGEIHVFGTGISVQVPDGWGLFLHSRSGMGVKHGVRLVNSTGVIDRDYRGELLVGLQNAGRGPVQINRLDRIAQGVMLWAPRPVLREVEVLGSTVRGTRGFGSSGK